MSLVRTSMSLSKNYFVSSRAMLHLNWFSKKCSDPARNAGSKCLFELTDVLFVCRTVTYRIKQRASVMSFCCCNYGNFFFFFFFLYPKPDELERLLHWQVVSYKSGKCHQTYAAPLQEGTMRQVWWWWFTHCPELVKQWNLQRKLFLKTGRKVKGGKYLTKWDFGLLLANLRFHFF